MYVIGQEAGHLYAVAGQLTNQSTLGSGFRQRVKRGAGRVGKNGETRAPPPTHTNAHMTNEGTR